ncbi:alpha/beta hydrolase domain-containing protein [Humitalea sp. 24SJ18S-53]|uniref:alpha/beta hydrolase domain-containing protein n=1 Tax=Humitalea sp. 24SJ18S-53 TaxID=3422307 RepID=UPI003D67D12D
MAVNNFMCVKAKIARFRVVFVCLDTADGRDIRFGLQIREGGRALPEQLAGAVRRFDIHERISPVFGGREFGDAGAYELLLGIAEMEADPAHPLNAPIELLDQAPCNAAGRVVYDVDVCLLKPIDTARGNGWLVVEVPNRGGKRCLVRINDAAPENRPQHAGDEGNGYLMREGYTVAWCGWQGDVPTTKGRMAGRFPTVRTRRRVREEFIVDAPGSVRGEMTREIDAQRFVATLTWPAASLDPADATLTARQQERDARGTPAGLAFRYLDDRHIEITRPDRQEFDRGTIFEFIYTAGESAVMGLGLAAIRDVTSFLRHDRTAANPLAGGGIHHALCFGLSQSGRVIRDFLYHGFNRGDRAVFDAAMPVIAGSRRSDVVQGFAQPGRYSRQHEDHDYGDDQFPFTYPTLADPISGRTDGILAQAGPPVKVMHVDTDSEVWSARASLVATDTEGRDIAMPESVRLYLASGLPHGAYEAPDPRVIRYLSNPLNYGPLVRALLPALRDWVERGVAPPDSRFPSHAAGTWRGIDAARDAFPRGLDFPSRLNELRLMDHATQPPTAGASYPVFVAATDADGNGIGGWRHPLMQAALATYTGWNLRRPGFAEGALYSIAGSCIPLPRITAPNDGRVSIAARYASRHAWKDALRTACTDLIAARLLLLEDMDRLMEDADEIWETMGA